MFDDFLKADFLTQCVAAVGLWLILTAVNLGAGFAQSKQGKGTTWRWLWVSGAVALLQISPLLMYWVAHPLINDPFEAGRPDHPLMRITEIGNFSGLISCYCVFVTLWTLRAAFPLPNPWTPLPLATDPQVEAELRQVTASMKIPVPVTTFYRGPLVSLDVSTLAGGLWVPLLFLADGVRMQFSAAERLAIFAKQCARLNNHSFWSPVLAPAISGCFVVLAACWSGISETNTLIAVVFLHLGLLRQLSRYFEFESDRRAGWGIGFQEMTKELQKPLVAYSASNIGTAPLRQIMSFSLPSLEERLSALHKAAPISDRPVIIWPEEIAQRHRTISYAINLLSILSLIYSLFIDPQSTIATVLLVSMLLAPFYPIVRKLDPQADADRRRQFPLLMQPTVYVTLLTSGILFPVVFFAVMRSVYDFQENQLLWLCSFVSVGAAMALYFVFLLRSAVVFGDVRLENAFAQQRWSEVLRFAERFPSKISSNPRNQLIVCIARWETGDQDSATSQLETLKINFPRHKQSTVTLAYYAIEEGDYEKAFRLARNVQPELKQDLLPHFIAARAARLLGNSKEVAHELAAMKKIHLQAPMTATVQLMLDLDKGDLEAAKCSRQTLKFRGQTDAISRLLEAELDWRIGERAAAEQMLEQVQSIVKGAPAVHATAELSALQQKMNQSDSDSHTARSTPLSSPDFSTPSGQAPLADI